MKVAFNATAMLPSLTGIGRYAREIAHGLHTSADIDAEFMYGLRWSRAVRSAAMPGANALFPILRDKLRAGGYGPRRWAQTLSLASRDLSARFDLYHEPAVVALPFRGPTVITVHDLSWIRYPETQPQARVRALNRYFEQGIRRASMVLTPSEFVRKDIIGTFALDPSKVRTTHLAADTAFSPLHNQQTAPTLNRFGLQHGQYIIAVGTLEPRKNLSAALDAFAQLPPSDRARFPLVLVGMAGWNSSVLQKKLDALVVDGQVRQLGYLPHADLVALTAGAHLMLFPSLYEGFGLPPLEAMACGVPSVVAHVASLPEVVGDAGLWVEPDDSTAIAQSILRIIHDPLKRAELSELGIRRAKLFSWKKCVAQTIDAYRVALT